MYTTIRKSEERGEDRGVGWRAPRSLREGTVRILRREEYVDVGAALKEFLRAAKRFCHAWKTARRPPQGCSVPARSSGLLVAGRTGLFFDLVAGAHCAAGTLRLPGLLIRPGYAHIASA